MLAQWLQRVLLVVLLGLRGVLLGLREGAVYHAHARAHGHLLLGAGAHLHDHVLHVLHDRPYKLPKPHHGLHGLHVGLLLRQEAGAEA